MGQYYQFINRTRREISQISLPFNFGMPYAKALESCDAAKIEAMFRFVIQHNADWTEADDLVAEGDYGEQIRFEPGQAASQEDYAWASYSPEPAPPKPWDAK